ACPPFQRLQIGCCILSVERIAIVSNSLTPLISLHRNHLHTFSLTPPSAFIPHRNRLFAHLPVLTDCLPRGPAGSGNDPRVAFDHAECVCPEETDCTFLLKP